MSRVSEGTTQMPSGLRIESTVVCSIPRTVKTEGSIHEVRAVNRSLNAYVVTTKATCEPSEICYVTSSGNFSSWSEIIRIPSRPGRGGKSKQMKSCPLSSLGRSEGATVRLDVVAQLVGFTYTATDSLALQVDTA